MHTVQNLPPDLRQGFQTLEWSVHNHALCFGETLLIISVFMQGFQVLSII